jgi:trimeric autotransporter adhesin
MRRFLTLVCLLGLALPAGISISGCIRNPQGNYCNGLGYGPKDTDISSLTLQPEIAGISLAYGQTTQIQSPSAFTCKGNAASVGANAISYGTTNNQLVDLSPSGQLCAGTWNRNTGGGIADYTYCYYPNPLPSTGGLPYAVAYITATAYSVTSNPVAVYIHAPVTAISLVTTSLSSSSPQQCFSQNQQAALDSQACYVSNGIQRQFCAPSSVSVANFACTGTVPITAGTLTAPSGGSSIVGSTGQYCNLTNFNNGAAGATATVPLTGTNVIAPGTALVITNGGAGATAPPTQAVLSNGTANCSGTASVATTLLQVPLCGASIGTLNYSVSNSNVATFNSVTSVLTAQQPGTTSITATIAQSASSAGYFSTCPAKSINLTLPSGTTPTKGVVTQGVTQNLTTTVLDTNNNPINGMNLSYESTNPIDVVVSSGGAITAPFPGVASIYAVCEPSSCNPAPINEFGLNGTGLPLTSNPVSITVPGTTSDFVWFGAPGQSQYFASIELLTGNPGSTGRLPYVPNSMVMDQGGNSLYFGSARELMIYSTASNSLTGQNSSAPGVVLAVSPNNNELVVNDQIRGLFYLFSTASGPTSSFGGMGVAAAWTPDSNTLYIVDNALANSPASCTSPLITGHTDTLYVYNVNVGWSTYPLPPNPLPPAALPTCTTQPDAPISTNMQALAVTVPAIGAYLAGNPTVAHTWCPSGTVGNNFTLQFYPQSDSVNVLTNVLGATTDGAHILGASLSGSSITLDDIGLSIPPNSTSLALCPEITTGTPPNQVETMAPLSTNPTIDGTVNLTGVTNATAVNQVVTGAAPTTASVSTAAPIAFVTYATPSASTSTSCTPGNPTTAAELPYYLPQASGAGPAGYVKFTCGSAATPTPATAPLFGTFSPDNSIFFVSTAGDNEIHFISIPTNVNNTTAPPTDTQQYSPNLPACTPVSEGGNDAGCLYPTTLPVPTPATVVPATVITVKPRSVT